MTMQRIGETMFDIGMLGGAALLLLALVGYFLWKVAPHFVS
jgi:hypothetical protein